MTNINIWVPLSFSHNFLNLSQMVFKVTLRILEKVKICVLIVQDANFKMSLIFQKCFAKSSIWAPIPRSCFFTK